MTALYVASLVWMCILTILFWQMNERSNRLATLTFTGVLLTTLFWGLFRFFVIVDPSNATTFVKIANLAGDFVPAFFLHFTTVYPLETNIFLERIVKYNIRKIYLLATAGSVLVASPYGVQSVITEGHGIDINEFSFGFVVYAVIFIFLFLVAIILLFLKLHHLNNKDRNNALGVIVSVGLVVVVIAGFNLLPDLFDNNVQEIDALSEFPVTILASTYLIYSISKNLLTEKVELESAAKLKDEFLGIASHQLRTPLTIVKGSLGLLKQSSKKMTKKDKKEIENLEYGINRMEVLVGQLMNVSLIDAGKISIVKRNFDLGKTVEETIQQFEDRLRSQNIHAVARNSHTYIQADKARIIEVISNFIDNAIHYTPKNGTIKISVQKKGDRAVVKIVDSGIGIPLSEQKNLFTKFSRGSNAKKARPDGTGLGLYIAKQIIEAHGGEIIFRSKENKGSTFGFSLPIAK